MSKMQRVLIIILSIFFMTACTMPETKIYSIPIPVDRITDNTMSDSSMHLLMRSPRYLEQPYIAHRISPYQLEISKYSKWDSSPVVIVKDAFKNSLSTIFKEVRVSNFISDSSFSIEITLRSFERIDAGNDSFGELVLDVSLLSPDGIEVYSNIITKKVKLDRRDDLSLAKSLSTALSEGVEEVRIGIVKRNNLF
jgi:ABC-type uncharacterized transport system auxiliary subunit